MSKRERSPKPELELKLSTSQTAKSLLSESSDSSSLCLYSSSDEQSCLTSEPNQEMGTMVLAGCLRCLMYVLVSKDDPSPKCPKCKSTVLLDFLNNNQNTNQKTT